MAIKQPCMMKTVELPGTASISLTAKPGESLRIKELRIGALASGGFAEIFIDRVSVGFWYIGDINANHLEQWSLATLLGNVFKRMIDKGLFAGYPVAEGQTFEIKPRVAGTEVVGTIVYEIGEKDDFKADMPNGSNSKEFFFLNYGTNTSIIPVTTIGAINKTRNPSEYPAFPFGEVVPGRTQVDIYGFLMMTWKTAFGVLNPNYSYLKLTKDRQVLFDELRNGIYVREGMGLLTWGPCRQTNCDVELFPEPLTFKAGDELQVQLLVSNVEIPANGVYLASIQRVTTLE